MKQLLKTNGFEMVQENYDKDTCVIKSISTGRRYRVRKNAEEAEQNIILILISESR